MKKLLFLGLLCLVGCVDRPPGLETCESEPRFRYGDKVKITSGFYKGATGTVVSAGCTMVTLPNKETWTTKGYSVSATLIYPEDITTYATLEISSDKLEKYDGL